VTWTARWYERLLRPVDVAWLAAFRFLTGSLLALSLQRSLAHGWVDELLLAPRFHFKYWGLAWVEPLSPPGMHALFWALSGLGLCMAAGLAFRWTAAAFALGFTYVQLIDVTNYLNHYYLAVLLCWLLALSPAGRAWSADAWLVKSWRARLRAGPSAPAAPTPTVPVAWQLLFRVQVGLVYVFAGLGKAQSDWLWHGQPLRIWLGANTKLPLLGRLFTFEEVPLWMSWAGFLFDTSIVAWLLFRKTRPWAYLVAIVFHLLTQLLFNIGMFPAIMLCSALVFFSASWPRHAWARLCSALGWLGAASSAPAPAAADREETRQAHAGLVQSEPLPARRATHWQKLWLGLGLGYCLIQLLLPLRHWLYPGNVLWHEQGMRFSWRVMVRVKGGGTTFLVGQPQLGKVWRVSPRDYLTSRQEAEMSSQPDLILQLAQHIQQDYENRGFGPVEVRAESRATLNGRRSAVLIDPNVDLTRVRDGIAPAHWVLPAPDLPPPHTRPVL
jgi:hypothetical protein